MIKPLLHRLYIFLSTGFGLLIKTLPRKTLATSLQRTNASSTTLAFSSSIQDDFALLRGKTPAPSTPVQIHLTYDGADPQTIETLSSRHGIVCEIIPLNPTLMTLSVSTSHRDGDSGLLHELPVEDVIATELPAWERTLRILHRVWTFMPDELLSRPLQRRFRDLDLLYETIRQHRVQRFFGDAYTHFIDEVEPTQVAEVNANALAHVQPAPLFLIVIYGDSSKYKETSLSLSSQTYPHWSVKSEEHPEKSEYGDNTWILPLRAGDMLRKDALAQFALAAKNSPAASLIYADHDFFSQKRTRCKPVFKPDWNYDLFLTHDYIASPCAFASRTCSKYHLNPVELTSSEHRYDLILLVAKTSPEEIIHIPGVLLHRLAEDPNPTGADPAPISPLLRHLSSHGATATPGSLPQTHRIRWPLPTSPLVSILIATRDHSQILRKCITSIQRLTTYPHWEIVLIDNQSSDPDCLSYLKQLDDTQNIRVIPYNFPFNYSAIQNFGVSQCRGEVIAFMNNDIEIISPTWLEDLVRQAIRPEVGAVGAKLLYSDGRVQHAGVALGIGGVAGHLHRYSPGDSPGYCGRLQLAHQLTAVTAACLVIKKYTFESVGGFNEKHLKIALNDVDLCLKLHRLGLKNIYEPAAVLYHHESLSRGPDDTLAKRRVFLQEREWMLAQWPDLIARDPHYNPNLTLEHEDFSVTTHRPGASRPAAKRGW